MNITKKGETLSLVGTQPTVGTKAPDFSLPNLNDESVSLKEFLGVPVLISVVPDIDTRVCSIQTKHFNQEAANISGVKFITISNNTKKEQENWCATEGVDMEMLHDDKDEFANSYGLYIPEMKRLARSIFVVDKAGKLVYEEIVSEITNEPDYQTALEKAVDAILN